MGGNGNPNPFSGLKESPSLLSKFVPGLFTHLLVLEMYLLLPMARLTLDEAPRYLSRYGGWA